MTSLKQQARIMQAADADARANASWARRHLARLAPERREQLEREWLEAATDPRFSRNPNSDEIKARADEEWRSCA